MPRNIVITIIRYIRIPDIGVRQYRDNGLIFSRKANNDCSCSRLLVRKAGVRRRIEYDRYVKDAGKK